MSTPSKKEEILKELYKCGKDPIYFLNTYAKIKHKQKGILPFKTWDFQDKVIKDFIDHEFNIILKSRQLGISTVSAGYVAWLMLFNQSKMVMVIATKQEVAKNFVTKVKVILELLPPWFQKVAKVVVNNETSLRLSNYSELKSSTTAADAGRSEGLSLLIIDEAAHIENMDEIWIALKPTISGGGRVIALSSPNGASGWFYNTYTKAEQGENDFNPIKLMWDVHPERDQAWFDKEVKTESPRFIAQEYSCMFVGSGRTVIEGEKIVLLEHRAQDPIYTSGDDGNIWVFEDPEQDVDYFLVADVARGDGEDYSTFHIFKKSNLEQVAEYRGKVKADEFAPLIYDVAKIYGNCLVVVENNVIGLEVANLLAKMDYENLYYQDKRTREYLPPHMVRDNEYALAGFAVQDKNIRDKLIVSFENTVRNDRIIIKSKRLINEIQTFVWTLRGKAEASKGKHDDLVMPCAIACFLKDTLFTDDEDRQGATILNSALFFSKSVVKFNTAVPGMDNFNNDSAFKGINSPKTLSEKYRPLMIYKG